MLREKNIDLSSVKYGTLDIVIISHHYYSHWSHDFISNIDHISQDYHSHWSHDHQ